MQIAAKDLDGAINRINDLLYLVRGRHGLFLAQANDFYLGGALLRYGEYGEIEGQLLQQMVHPGMTVVEVGANIGTHTVPLARAVGPQGRVIAIEPQPVIHQQLCANITLNGLRNVITHLCGCGAETGVLYRPPVDYDADIQGNFGGVSLHSVPVGMPVPVHLLDALVGDVPIQLIKIDVEGMEGDVLAGAKETLRRNRPLLYVENDRVEKSAALIQQLFDLGYRLWWHLPPLFNPDNYFGVVENDYGGVVSINMLCIPAERDANVSGLTEVTDASQHPLVSRL